MAAEWMNPEEMLLKYFGENTSTVLAFISKLASPWHLSLYTSSSGGTLASKENKHPLPKKQQKEKTKQ